jgi:hypothetical protein
MPSHGAGLPQLSVRPGSSRLIDLSYETAARWFANDYIRDVSTSALQSRSIKGEKQKTALGDRLPTHRCGGRHVVLLGGSFSQVSPSSRLFYMFHFRVRSPVEIGNPPVLKFYTQSFLQLASHLGGSTVMVIFQVLVPYNFMQNQSTIYIINSSRWEFLQLYSILYAGCSYIYDASFSLLNFEVSCEEIICQT